MGDRQRIEDSVRREDLEQVEWMSVVLDLAFSVVFEAGTLAGLSIDKSDDKEEAVRNTNAIYNFAREIVVSIPNSETIGGAKQATLDCTMKLHNYVAFLHNNETEMVQ